ncbi:MAG: relaxase/mobilization nuclease domain-containing protein [Litoreibacter sp.]|uniref:relaxase/mobilization nuclease domain-containing protein n=1 Tax=Litoreibacter sp. TaxID=1969459 RepID=UPI003298CB6A
MILKGSQRAGAVALADHLMNDRDNDHVSVMEIRGFVADDLHGALSEAHAISKATQCTQFMFSLSLSPPQDHVATEEELLDAANRAEEKLGLGGQPRAIILHEKENRRHAHAVWSRIDGDEMRAINMSHFKTKLTDLSRELYLDHGWELPNGLQSHGGKNPLNFTLSEWQQAKRVGVDPREIKQLFVDAWERSDNLKSFKNAIEERGYFLAKGDRRGFVAVDVNGERFSLARPVGQKAKDVRDKLGSPDVLASVADVRVDVKSKVTSQLKSYIAQIKTKHGEDARPLLDEKAQMMKLHRHERKVLKDGQAIRWTQETIARQQRLNGGLRGLFDKLTGKNGKARRINETEAMQCAKRDQVQRDSLVLAHMRSRKALQRKFVTLRDKQAQDRKILARSIGQALRTHRHTDDQSHRRQRNRDRRLNLSP